MLQVCMRKKPFELLKLHLQHYHMSLKDFKKRTSALQIPKDIYERITETGRYAPKPKPKVKVPYTASDGTILDGVML